MKWNEILVRYGELSLKGRNRNLFVQRLRKNVKFQTKDLETVSVHAERDRMFIRAEDESEIEEVLQRLQHVFGIHSYSPIARTERTDEAIEKLVLDVLSMKDLTGKTFKVEAKRADKTYGKTSQQIQQWIGAHALRNYPELTAQMKNPDFVLHVDIRRDAAYISSEVYKGPGGFPVGSSGRSLLMLSGGIDSPVAGYYMMKRGVALEAIHFASPPYTSDLAKEKVLDLAEHLSKFGPTIKVHVIPFTKIQKLIDEKIPANLTMTVTRRLMMRIADRVREERGLLGIVTGESIGQVASQTLESMTAINAVTATPIIRPLVTFDKSEIIETSEHIGTYDISIRPYEDCCTIFTPANPTTKPRLDKVEHFEGQVDFEELITEAVNEREVVISTKREKVASFSELL
ncbi:tRNA 4-thiouridine(8) synthase ThiI [Savagea sp. SN6]|uniref:Probable tRNA sulfurtransferase n=1 Tax=Savagea serpentis TaxID=2785297 RepID=A0A8J7G9J7_9BACL|nr:tRNA uracil 4-sulfurtransferase ThiI [Savagea serpentis]MBF4501723.1 tRNA 4-thiouridine(8) synthase ThiI [Savagea serpentis]